MDRVVALRRQVREADETVSDRERRDLWKEAQDQLSKVRLYGDLVLSAFFEGSKAKDRESKRSEYADLVLRGEPESHRVRLEDWRSADPPLTPFHWEIEFPEVFERENPGFDAIAGNPPFAGKNSVAAANVSGYPDWLKQAHEESHGNADLVAHFFRLAFDRVRKNGTYGLIATNTIAQGDTRSSGLRWVCAHGGEIYSAQKRVKWPGQAAVVVSVLHVMKGEFRGSKRIDGRAVDTITAFLFHRGGNDDPARLVSNAGKSFVGSYVLGMGFTFDDTDTKGIANSLADMRKLVQENPRNQEVIFPYIGGEEVNTSPTHAYHRFVINFGQRSEQECRQRWPTLMAIVEEKVKPDRKKLTRNAIGRKRASLWWQYGSQANDLYAAIAGLERVLVTSAAAASHHTIALVPARQVYSHKLIVFALSGYAPFAALQSRVHEIWSKHFGTTRGVADDLTYNPTQVFQTFPFPENWETRPALEAAGKEYYEFRAALMIRHDEGLTKTYNRFHDPYETDPEIEKLRELHAAMDRAVLDAYGWRDISTDCQFLLDYQIDEEDWNPRRKKPYRYRWPDDVHDEVLARLLERNAQRAKEELLSGAAAQAKKSGRKKSARRPPKGPTTGNLFS